MNYQKIYENLTAKDMIADYTEKHHIIPRCMGGSNDHRNLVRLTPEAHYVAHQLLVKIYPDNALLIYAANMMTCGRNTNKSYSWIRRKHAVSMRDANLGKTLSIKIRAKMKAAMTPERRKRLSDSKKGKGNPMYRKTHTAETRAKISAAKKGKLNPMYGIPCTAETRAKISASQCAAMTLERRKRISDSKKGHTVSYETRAKISTSMKGRLHTANTREKMRIAKSGKSQIKVTCPHCNKEGGICNMKRWHFDNCKLKP